MLTRLAAKMLRPLAEAVFLKHVRRIANGDYGERWRNIYWSLVGKKTAIGLALAIVAVVGLRYDHPTLGTVLAALSYIAIKAGALDKGWRNFRPDWMTESGVYRWLAQHPAEVASVFGAAFAWVANDCAGAIMAWGWTGHPWCDWGRIALIALMDVSIFLGLLEATYKAPAPRMPPPKAAEGW